MTLLAIFKFNPYHDEKGRFATADGHASRSPAQGQGIDFVSPNKANLSYVRAKERLQSREQSLLVQYGTKINAALGIKGSIASVVGAWADGAENSTVGVYDDDTPYEAIRAAASLKGLLERQKAVIAFKARPKGKARVSMLELKGGLDIHHNAMIEAGIEFHTLQPTADGVKAWVFQDKSSSALNTKLAHYAKSMGGQLTTWAGDGEFVGSWSSRTEGKAAYLKELDSYTERHPETKAGIDGILKDWRRRSGQ